MKLAEILDAVPLLACITLFLSRRVLSRSLSYERFSNCHCLAYHSEANLSLLLEVEGIDFLKLSFLPATVSIHHCIPITSDCRTNLKKNVALFACREA